MNELMVYVEKIVRPVRARASRKLRMRRELLAHLQAVVEQEQAAGLDEQASAERAKQRLGEPAVLTPQLQASVPTLERLLLSRLPVGRSLERWEEKFGHAIYGANSPTFGYAFILMVMAVLLTCIPYTHRRWLFTNLQTVLVTLFLGQWVILFFAYRFAFLVSQPPPRRHRVLFQRYAVAILVLHAALRLILYRETHGDFDSIIKVIHATCVTGLHMSIIAVMLYLAVRVGRLVAARREPYDEWLAINVAA